MPASNLPTLRLAFAHTIPKSKPNQKNLKGELKRQRDGDRKEPDAATIPGNSLTAKRGETNKKTRFLSVRNVQNP